MKEAIKERLDALGYKFDEDTDGSMLDFIIKKVANQIYNFCNITSIPEGLGEVYIDMICGEFLLNKKNSGQLEGFSVDLDLSAKQINVGDTSISLTSESSQTPEQRLNKLIDYLMNSNKSQLIKYRKMSW